MKNDRWVLFAVAGLMLIGFLLRFPQIFYGLPASRYPESVNTILPARDLSNAWKSGQFKIDPGNYLYPAFYTNLLALSFLLTNNAIDAEAMGRLLSLLFGLACVPIGYCLARKCDSAEAGVISASLISLSLLFVREGRHPGPDSLHALMVSCALYFLLKFEKLDRRQIFLSGLFTGFGFATKFFAPVFVAPALLFLEITRSDKKFLFRLNDFALWSGAIAFGAFLASPSLYTEFGLYWRELELNHKVQQTGMITHHATNFFDYFFSDRALKFEGNVSNSFVGTMSWPVVIAALTACGWFSVRRKNHRRAFALVLSFVLAYAYIASFKIHRMRFMLPLGVVVSALTAMFIVQAAQFLSRWIQDRGINSISAKTITAGMGLVVIFPAMSLSLTYLKAFEKKDTRLETVEWMIQNVPRGDRVLNFMFGPALPRNFYSMIQWKFPEYLVELDPSLQQGPSFDRLREEEIQWVIWNGYYTRPFFDERPRPETVAYVDSWKQFFNDLNSKSVRRLELEGSDSAPFITIFQIDKNPE